MRWQTRILKWENIYQIYSENTLCRAAYTGLNHRDGNLVYTGLFLSRIEVQLHSFIPLIRICS